MVTTSSYFGLGDTAVAAAAPGLLGEAAAREGEVAALEGKWAAREYELAALQGDTWSAAARELEGKAGTAAAAP